MAASLRASSPLPPICGWSNRRVMTPISDIEFSAYVDGETFPERQAVIEAWLARNPADAARVKAWRRQNQALRAAFGGIPAEPPPAELLLVGRDEAPAASNVATLIPAHAPLPRPMDRHDRLALIVAASFLAGAGVACLAGFLAGLH